MYWLKVDGDYILHSQILVLGQLYYLFYPSLLALPFARTGVLMGLFLL